MTKKEVLNIAREEVGYCEKESKQRLYEKTANAGDGNYTKYAEELDEIKFYNGKKQGFDWCSVFLGWCFFKSSNRSSALSAIYQPEKANCGASCTLWMKYFKKAGAFFEYPEIGDIVFFKGSSEGTSGHVGIVERVTEEGFICTIEGNQGNKVKTMVYSKKSGKICGYGRPKYDISIGSEPEDDVEYKVKVTSPIGLNVRTGATTSNKKIFALKYNTVVTVIDESNGWGLIKYNGKEGWICLNYTKRVDE